MKDAEEWKRTMEQLYTWLYLIILVPGLLGNSLALWVLCRFIRSDQVAHTNCKPDHNSVTHRVFIIIIILLTNAVNRMMTQMAVFHQ